MVAESARPILRLISFEEYAILELLGNLDQLKLTDIRMTAASQFPQILFLDVSLTPTIFFIIGTLVIIIMFHECIVG